MKVTLAGFNVDAEILKDCARNRAAILTPETISAAYARISRSASPVGQLRRMARNEVEKARRSNRTIIFEMGHHSVAEHAVFNFDLVGLSRLAIEEVEHFRLCSFTEKSQRYVTLEGEFATPEEIRGSQFHQPFTKAIEYQNRTYALLCSELTDHLLRRCSHLADSKHGLRDLENQAKEDARYVLSLATEGQLGMTVNARNLELMVRRFASHGLAEVRTLSKKLFSAVSKVAPSLILFHQANNYDQKTYAGLNEQAQEILAEKERTRERARGPVALMGFTPDADNRLVAALLHTVCRKPYQTCLGRASRLSFARKRTLIMTALEHMELYDAALREFEHVDLTYELVVSASCFAQLKRHRLATLTCQRYDTGLRSTMPDSIGEIGESPRFREVMERTERTYRQIRGEFPLAAQYILTNAHRRRVLLTVNARELYHISRLREDSSAQWDIRQTVAEMVRQARTVMPLTCLMLGGKDQYPRIYEGVYGKPPTVVSPSVPGERTIADA